MTVFPLTAILKFQSATFFFKTWPIAKKSDSLYSTMVAQCPHKVWLTWDENRRNSVLKFPAHMVLCSKFQSAIKFLFFFFWRSAKNVIAYISSWWLYFVRRLVEIWWKLLKNRGIRNYAKCTEWPKTNLKESGIKSTLSPKFSSVSLHDQPFSI